MFKLKKSHIYASEIAEFLNAHMYGEDFIIEEPCSAARLKKNGITFIFDEKYMSQLDETIYPLF
jgi:hypothetical protein